jgi:hypothetical protein
MTKTTMRQALDTRNGVNDGGGGELRSSGSRLPTSTPVLISPALAQACALALLGGSHTWERRTTNTTPSPFSHSTPELHINSHLHPLPSSSNVHESHLLFVCFLEVIPFSALNLGHPAATSRNPRQTSSSPHKKPSVGAQAKWRANPRRERRARDHRSSLADLT